MIDKISLTLSANRDQHDIIASNFHEARWGRRDLESVVFGDLLKNYYYAWKLNFANGEHCIIQHSPRRGTTNFLRLEYNPAKIERTSIRKIYALLNSCMPTFAEALQRARITRLDLAFDLPIVEVDRILVFDTPRKLVSKTFSTAGRMNALTIGSQESTRFLLIYDKQLEQAAQSGRLIGQIKTRFELRLRDLRSWENLQLIANPFAHYSVIEFQQASEHSIEHEWHWMVYASSVIGAQAVLSLVKNRTLRRRYRNALRSLQPPPWWNPDEIWAEVPHALRYAFLGDV